jgi:hypothetical protein
MLTEKLEAIRFYFKLFGLKGGIGFAVNLMCCGRETIYSVGLTEQQSDHSAIINPRLDFRFIENTEQYEAFMSDYAAARGKTLAKCDREKIASGKDYLAVIYRQGRLAGWGWIKKGPLKYGNCKLELSDCVIHKCRTLREHRKHGVYVTLLVNLQNALAHRGFEQVYVGAKSFNKVSLHGIEKAGFRFVEECDLGSFWSRLLHHLRGKGPKVMQSCG